jgi:hypothetical protein
MNEEIMATEADEAAVEFGAETVESSRAMVEAERVMPTDFAHHAALHYAKAVRKHPRFADALHKYTDVKFAEADLEKMRDKLNFMRECDAVSADELVECEMLEAFCAKSAQDAISELYDAVAVLMRMIAVVEGKQKLGGAE